MRKQWQNYDADGVTEYSDKSVETQVETVWYLDGQVAGIRLGPKKNIGFIITFKLWIIHH